MAILLASCGTPYAPEATEPLSGEWAEYKKTTYSDDKYKSKEYRQTGRLYQFDTDGSFIAKDIAMESGYNH